MQKVTIQYFLTSFLLLNIGCSKDAGFTGDSSAAGNSSNSSQSIEDRVITEKFQWQGETNENLDVVWVIDNSTSMNTEAQHVRQNFTKFINYVEGQSNLKLALISARQGAARNGVTLEQAATSENYLQIPKFVDSNEGLEIVLDNLDDELGNFLRPNSEKAFIFVTDDESKKVGSDDFSQALKSKFPAKDFVAHGFVSLGDAESPCGANQGMEYQTLSLASGGKTFNICDQNWEQHFETLAKAVSSQVQAKFTLGAEINKEDILNVKVNGKDILAADFSLEGMTLSISPKSFVANQPNTIDISYIGK